jgi:hypothetical protein
MIDFYSIKSFEEIFEFHNIMPIANITSVLKDGILSHDEAEQIYHISIAMQEVQDRRNKEVPGGLRLHQYANLYFHARNPMLFKRQREDICVLRIYKSICNFSGVVFTDRNAASDWVSFLSINEITTLNFPAIYAKYWNDENPSVKAWAVSTKQAEILIPNRVPVEYIIGAYVKNENDRNILQESCSDLHIEVNKEMFFG